MVHNSRLPIQPRKQYNQIQLKINRTKGNWTQGESIFVLKFRPWFLDHIIVHAKFSRRYVHHEKVIFSEAKIKTTGKSIHSILSKTGKDVILFVANRLRQF